MRIILSSAICAACLSSVLVSSDAGGAARPERAEVWQIELGSSVDEIEETLFADYACGTNGGPPSRPIASFREFQICRPEEDGLREVYFRYDDELEYWAKANNLPLVVSHFSGTKIFEFPIVASVLIDTGGTIDGLRIVTDPRDNSFPREELHNLSVFLKSRFGREGWDCMQLPAGPGETPVAGVFIKETCSKFTAEMRMTLITHYLRRPGQAMIDPHRGVATEGQFVSEVRFELRSPI
jgi:hypothetical protein